jgi:(4S)-4-hydroxy-5-phosphonooxypentane-2,3-dione isomerase
MIANFVVFELKPGKRAEFVAASLANSRGSIDGPDCLATSIFEDPDRRDVAYVFEVFRDEAAFTAHHEQDYYKQWLAATADLMRRPYQLLQSTSFPDATSFRHLRLAVAGDPDPSAWVGEERAGD